MTALAKVFVEVRGDTSKLAGDVRSGVSKLSDSGDAAGRGFSDGFEQQTTSRFSKGAKRLAVGLAGAFASRQVLIGAKALVDRASDLNETATKSAVVFGDADKAVGRFAKTALTSIGQTEQSALDATATFGVFGKAAGLAPKENAKFSKSLVKLSSDMASFSNTSPEEAIEALGSGLRGEAEPLRKYGVLLDDATLRNQALKLGLIDSVKTALTPANKVLAAQAEIMAQTADAQGDFARTSDGLANQQRIVGAQVETLKTKLGAGLLPVFNAAALVLSEKLLPPLIDLADKWVPRAADAISTFIAEADFSKFADSLGSIDFASLSGDASGLGDSFRDIGASLRSVDFSALRDAFGQGLSDTVSVFSVAIGFAADHIDTLVALMPTLVVAFAAYKTAQALSNVVSLAALPIQTANVAALLLSARANQALAAQMRITTGVEKVSLLTRLRTTTATVASAVASKVAAGAAKVWAAGQWVLNAALTANPIGLVIVAVAALAVGLFVAYKKSETFRKIVTGALDAAKVGAAVMWDRMKSILEAMGKFFTRTIPQAVGAFRDAVGAAFDKIRDKIAITALQIVDKVLGMVERITGAFAHIPGPLGDAFEAANGKVKAFREQVNREMDAINDENVVISLTTIKSAAANNAKRLDSPILGGAGPLPAFGGPSLTPRVVQNMSGLRSAVQTTAQTRNQIALQAAEGIQDKLKASAAKAAAASAGLGKAGPGGRVLPAGSYRIGMPYHGYPGHNGADYPAATGTPVYAPYAGRVTASYDLPGSNPYNATPFRSYGKVVQIAYTNGLTSLFAHLSSRIGRTGTVAAGTMVGRVGMNGNATGPHLHAEFNGGSTNPASTGLFDRGGILRSGGAAVNLSGRPERILDPRTTRNFERLTYAMERSGGDAGVQIHVDKIETRDDRAAAYQLRVETAKALTMARLG